jgi:hypothetical protein
VSRAEERAASEQFVDFVMDRLSVYPNLHIYPYARYEPAALKWLMGPCATREDELDLLLRGRAQRPSFISTFGAIPSLQCDNALHRADRERHKLGLRFLALDDFPDRQVYDFAQASDWLMQRAAMAKRLKAIEGWLTIRADRPDRESIPITCQA